MTIPVAPLTNNDDRLRNALFTAIDDNTIYDIFSPIVDINGVDHTSLPVLIVYLTSTPHELVVCEFVPLECLLVADLFTKTCYYLTYRENKQLEV